MYGVVWLTGGRLGFPFSNIKYVPIDTWVVGSVKSEFKFKDDVNYG